MNVDNNTITYTKVARSMASEPNGDRSSTNKQKEGARAIANTNAKPIIVAATWQQIETHITRRITSPLLARLLFRGDIVLHGLQQNVSCLSYPLFIFPLFWRNWTITLKN